MITDDFEITLGGDEELAISYEEFKETLKDRQELAETLQVAKEALFGIKNKYGLSNQEILNITNAVVWFALLDEES